MEKGYWKPHKVCSGDQRVYALKKRDLLRGEKEWI